MIVKRPSLAPGSLLALMLLALAVPATAGTTGPALHVGAPADGRLTLEPVGGAVRPVLPGAGELTETGKPVLPTQTINLLVPLDSPIIGLEIVALQTRRVELKAPLALGRPLVTDGGVEVPVDRLQAGPDAFPTIWGEFGGSHTWRGFRFVSAVIYPVRALRDESGGWVALEVLERYEVRPVHGAGIAPPDVAQRQRLVPGEREWCESVLRQLCVNSGALAGYDRVDGLAVAPPAGGFQPTLTPSVSGSPVSYLIVTRESLAAAFQPLADYKTSVGLPARVVTIEWLEANYRRGADPQETIRGFIREAYERWGLQYVLIGGDTDVVPARYGINTYYPIGSYTEIPTDLYFAGLDGNWNADGDWLYGEHYASSFTPGDNADLVEDVLVGRATVSTPAEAAVFVGKVVSYEGAAAGAGWPGRALFAAEVLFPSDYNPGDPISLDGAYFAQALVDDYLQPCTSMTSARLYETYALRGSEGQLVYPGSTRLTRAAVIDSLNAGHYGIVNQIGHGFYFNMSVGDANFTTGDASALVNGDRLFMIMGLNCASAAFDYGCLMERFLKNPNGGSIVSIGSSRAAFPHAANAFQREFFRHLYCEGSSRVGELIALSKLPYLATSYTNTVDRWTIMNYTLLGDPSLPLWSGSPRAAEVVAPNLQGGAQNVTVSVTAGGLPVAGARVCLAKAGDDYAWALTGPTGQAVLPFTATSSGSAVLTVTGRNLARTARTLAVNLGGGAYLRAESATVQDNGAAGTSGNGNGIAESGETVALRFTFRNTGSSASASATSLLGSAKAGVTILDPTAAVGPIPAGGVAVAADPFLVRLDAGIPDGDFLDFTLTATAGSSSYASEWTMTAAAPEVEPVALVWSDSPHGDGDGLLENGERVTVRIDLKNFGSGRADLVTGRLRTLDPGITLVDSVVTWSGLGPLALSSGGALFSLRDADVATESWCWVLFQDNHGRTFRHDFKLRPPTIPTGLVTDSSLGADVIGLTWLPLRNLGVRGYNVYRSDAPAGPFTRVNQDLVEWTSYFRDGGLALLSRYYYRVTAVDSSLVEGPPSTVVAQSTAPAEQASFPLPIGKETSSHLAVGDVNGDGIAEIVLGANEIYVWNALGEELRDGDQDAQTHGPITNLKTDFGLGGIALADLDGLPGLEIIVPERNSQPDDQNALHVMRHDGTPLPGWPQPLRQISSGSAWSVPAIGDVDGDGDLEIVLNTQDSRTWVWHHDGTELRDGDGDATTNGVFVYRGLVGEYGRVSPALFDLDGDGACEIIFGTRVADGPNYLLAYKYDGTQAPGFPYPLGTETTITSAVVADLDGDGTWEIVFNTRFGKLHVVRQNGTSYPGFPRAFSSGTGFNPSPAVGDFTGNGKLEIVAVATGSTLSSSIHVISASGATSGQTLAGWPQTVPGNSESSPVVADINGDGFLDVVFGIGGGNTDSPNNLYAYSAGGQLISGFPIKLGGPVRTVPWLTDLDRDGDVDIVYGGWDLQIHVWDMPFPYNPHRAPWPAFRGHIHRDGVHRPEELVGVPGAELPARLLLLPPAPNPFNPTTRVRLFLPGPAGSLAPLEVGVYDLRGRRVKVLHAGLLPTGWHDWIWDGRDGRGHAQPSGLYLLRAQGEHDTAVRKMSLLK